MFYTSAEVSPQDDKVAHRLGKIADLLFRRCRKDFNIRVGEREVLYTDNPDFTAVVDSPKTVRKLLLRPQPYAAGEAFLDKRVDIEGDLLAGLRARNLLSERPPDLRRSEKLKLLFNLLRI